jgi:transposase
LGCWEALDLGNQDMAQNGGQGRPPTTRRYSVAEKEQAVRLVRQLGQEPTLLGGNDRAGGGPAGDGRGVVTRLGETVRNRRRGSAGLSTSGAGWLKGLEPENRELGRPNQIVKRASAFFARRWSAGVVTSVGYFTVALDTLVSVRSAIRHDLGGNPSRSNGRSTPATSPSRRYRHRVRTR